MNTPTAPISPQTNLRYLIQTLLGKGGMGSVYSAYDRLTQTQVALKQVNGADVDTEFALALAREFRTLSGLRHPNIVAVLDYGFDAQRFPYYTMQLIEHGQPLSKFAIGLDTTGKIRLCLDILLALIYLHRCNIIHRDLKPHNVLVAQDGSVKVLDFGLALNRTLAQSSDDMAGTLHYMAPELFVGVPASIASDLYAVGVILYEVLTGTRPFEDNSLASLIGKIRNQPADLTLLPAPIVPVVRRLLAKEAADRYQHAQEVIEALCQATNIPLPSESALLRESFLQASAMVGRESELETLRAALQGVIDGRGGFWLVGGEGGVGKSRLTDELRAEALIRGVLVVRGQEVADGGLPYQAWRDPARRLCLNTALSDLEAGTLKAIVPDIATLLERPIPDVPELPGAQGQQRLLLTLVQLFKRQTQPVLLLLEDLHWSADSLAPLRQMQAVRDQLPHVLVVGTYRDDERPSLPEELDGVSVLGLSRLSDEAVVQLAESMLGAVGKHPNIVKLLHRETEGNAFFMVETVRALAEDAGALGAIDVHALPSSVYTGSIRRIVQRYLSRMPTTFHPLLKRAAIAGRAFDPNILTSDNTEFEAFVEAGANARIFEISDGVWRFSHDKLREGVIAQLTPDERREQHQAVAEAIERIYPHNSAYNEALLEHWHAADKPLRELEYLADVVRLQIEVRADYERAHSLIQRGLSLVKQDDPRIADLLILHSTLCERKSEIPEAKRWATQALEFSRQQGLKAQMAESLFNLGKHERDSGDYRAAYDYFQQSLNIYQALDDLRGIADNLNGLGLIRHEEGNYTSAEDYYQQSLTSSQKIDYRQGIARAFNNLGRIASAHGEIAKALDFFKQTQDIFRTIGDKWRTALSLNNIAVMLLNLGKAEDARTSLEEALSISREIGDKRLVATSLLNLGENAQAQGQNDAAVAYFTRSVDLFRQLEDRLGIVLTLELMAVVQLDKQSAAALPILIEALTTSLALQSVPRILAALLLWARLLALLGKPVQAAEVAGLVAAHPATEAETHEKGVVMLKAALSTVLAADVFEAAWARGAALELESTARSVLQENWEDLVAAHLVLVPQVSEPEPAPPTASSIDDTISPDDTVLLNRNMVDIEETQVGASPKE